MCKKNGISDTDDSKKGEVDGTCDSKEKFLHPFLAAGRHINDRTVETSAEKTRELDVHSGFDFNTDVNNTP